MARHDDLPSLNALRAFHAAADAESFTRAAERLSTSTSSISRYIAMLESELGVALFERTASGVRLSPTGKGYFERVSISLDQIRSATQSIRGSARMRGLVHLHALPTFGTQWLLPRLPRLKAVLPRHEVQIDLGLRRAAILPRGADLMILSDEFAPAEADRGGSARLFREVYTPVCSPKLLSGPQPLRTPSDLASHTLLVSRQLVAEWREWFRLTGGGEFDPNRCVQFESSSAAYFAARDGHGVALGERINVADAIRWGDLVAPFRQTALSKLHVSLFWSKEASCAQELNALIAELRQLVEETLGPNVDPFSAGWADLGHVSSNISQIGGPSDSD
ncbi:MAG: LysR substrate-binding domain-containing protein [Aestuariivirga sp.]|uniref:LysR substrate-binding domain-containing protein n=1 Tax=Aestuariivirga sp. TaxID=2650926 RepID=UPI0038CFF3A5